MRIRFKEVRETEKKGGGGLIKKAHKLMEEEQQRLQAEQLRQEEMNINLLHNNWGC